MLPPSLRQQIISLIHREVVPATGCTEPVAVALCVARAAEEACVHATSRGIISSVSLRRS